MLPLVSLLASTTGSVQSGDYRRVSGFDATAALFAAGAVLSSYEAAVRLTGGAVSASFATQRVGIEATKHPYCRPLSLHELGIALKSAAAGNGFGNGAAAAETKTKIQDRGIQCRITVAAFEVGRGWAAGCAVGLAKKFSAITSPVFPPFWIVWFYHRRSRQSITSFQNPSPN